MKKRQKTTKVKHASSMSSNWQKVLAIYIVVTILVGLGVGVGYYHVASMKYKDTVEKTVDTVTELNKQLKEVSDFTLQCLDENKEWRIQSLTTDIDKIVEFGELLESCIVHKGYEETVDYQMDYDNQDSIVATIYPKKIAGNDSFSVSPEIVIKLSFSYELMEKKEVFPTEEEYVAIAQSTLLSNSVAISIITYAVIGCLTAVYIIGNYIYRIKIKRT